MSGAFISALKMGFAENIMQRAGRNRDSTVLDLAREIRDTRNNFYILSAISMISLVGVLFLHTWELPAAVYLASFGFAVLNGRRLFRCANLLAAQMQRRLEQIARTRPEGIVC